MYLMGWSAGCLFIPRLGDLYGRRIPYLISLGVSVGVYLGLILSNNIYLTMAMFFLLGLATPGKSNIAYVYLLELVPTDWQTYVGTALLFADGSTMIFLSLYFRYLTKYWLPFQIYGIIATSVAFIGSFLAPESPKYLYSYKQYAAARDSLAHIARLNKVKNYRQQRFIFDTEY
jgi:MFS family permease